MSLHRIPLERKTNKKAIEEITLSAALTGWGSKEGRGAAVPVVQVRVGGVAEDTQQVIGGVLLQGQGAQHSSREALKRGGEGLVSSSGRQVQRQTNKGNSPYVFLVCHECSHAHPKHESVHLQNGNKTKCEQMLCHLQLNRTV